MQAIGAKIGKESVLLPDLESSNMIDILSIFRGQASLKKAPPSTSSELSTDSTALETSFVVGTLSAISATYKVPTVVTTVPSTTSSTTTSTTIPEVDPTPSDRLRYWLVATWISRRSNSAVIRSGINFRNRRAGSC